MFCVSHFIRRMKKWIVIDDMVYQKTVPVENRLSPTLIRMMLESAKDSILYSVSNLKFKRFLMVKVSLQIELIRQFKPREKLIHQENTSRHVITPAKVKGVGAN